MKLHSILAACLVLGVMAIPSFAQEKTDAAANQGGAKKLEAVKAKQDDVKALNEFFTKEFRSVASLMSTGKTAEAEKALAELETVVAGLSPENAQAKQMLAMAKRVIPSYRGQLEIARVSVDDLKKKLDATPTDAKSLAMLVQKASMSIGRIARSQPLEAEKQMKEINDYVTKLAAKVDDEAKKKAILGSTRSLARMESTIKSAKRLAELVGKPAADLNVETWVNGSPLTNKDLKGKVVLLDFWAVWCGPCIATFPHLREWQEKYDEKDFVIVGLTRYYNYKWNDEAGRASRSQEKVKPEVENEMLGKFAEHHKLHHRFAIQKDGELSKYYAVSGIPHVVVIDREGVVRLIRVGSGEQNAKDVGDMIEKLVNG